MHLAIRQLLLNSVQWFLTEIEPPHKLAPVVAFYRKGVESLADWLDKSPIEINGRYKKTESDLAAKGVPPKLARHIALMPALVPAPDLTRLSSGSGGTIASVAAVFFGLGQRLDFDWLTDQARGIVVQTSWQREAMASILADLAASQKRLTAAVVAPPGRKTANRKTPSTADKMANWLERHAPELERHDALMNEWRSAGIVDIAMLTLAARHLAGFAL
jgi:glutamate dehydrogenase